MLKILRRGFGGGKNVGSQSSGAGNRWQQGDWPRDCSTAGAGWSADGYCLSFQQSSRTADTASVAGNWGGLRGSRDGYHRCWALPSVDQDGRGPLRTTPG